MLLVHGCRRTRFPNNLYLTTATQKRLRCEWSGTTCLVEISLFLFLSLFLFFATSFGTVALPHTHPPTHTCCTHARQEHTSRHRGVVYLAAAEERPEGGRERSELLLLVAAGSGCRGTVLEVVSIAATLHCCYRSPALVSTMWCGVERSRMGKAQCS